MRKNEDLSLALGGSDFLNKTFEELLKERKILLNENVDDTLIERATMQILKWNKEDQGLPEEKRKKIFIYINSLGGDVFNGLNVVSAIRCSKTPIVGVCLSYAYSMGGIIFASCPNRYMFEYSSLLIHDGQTALSGSANKVKDLQKFYNAIDDKIKNVIVSNSNISSQEYDENMDRELYLLADECKEKGLCEGIIGIDIELDEVI